MPLLCLCLVLYYYKLQLIRPLSELHFYILLLFLLFTQILKIIFIHPPPHTFKIQKFELFTQPRANLMNKLYLRHDLLILYYFLCQDYFNLETFSIENKLKLHENKIKNNFFYT